MEQLDLLTIATDAYDPWGPGPLPEAASVFVAWLDRWQTLIAGALSAAAVAAVTLFVWRYEVWRMAGHAEQDKRRLARALSDEIVSISDRLFVARKLFDLIAPQQQIILLPEIARTFPVFNDHTRDLASFDDTTHRYVRFFYESLLEYDPLRTYFQDNEAILGTVDGGTVLQGNEGAFVYLTDLMLGLSDQLQTRLSAIEKGRDPPAWGDEWAKHKPYEPMEPS